MKKQFVLEPTDLTTLYIKFKSDENKLLKINSSFTIIILIINPKKMSQVNVNNEPKDPKMTNDVLARFKQKFESNDVVTKYFLNDDHNDDDEENDILKNVKNSNSKTMTRQKRDRIIKLLKGISVILD